jgi:hypothetical protein
MVSLDAKTGEIQTHFNVGFALEQPRFNPADGTVYVTSPDAGALYQLEPKDGKTKNRISLGPCGPTGLAINGQSQALIACRKTVTSLDLRTSTGQTFDQVAGGDVVTYDAQANRFFVASPQKSGSSAVAIFSGNPIDYIASVTTGPGKSAAYDETNDVVYTQAGDLGYAGIAGFRPPQTPQFIYPSDESIGIFAAVVLVILLLFVMVGRGADPVLRVEPEPRRRGSRSAST